MSTNQITPKNYDEAEYQKMVDYFQRAADRNRRLVEQSESAKELAKDPELFVVLRVGNIIWEEHEHRDLVTVQSKDSGFGDYDDWFIARNQKTTTVRLRYCDALELIETCDYISTSDQDSDELPDNIRGAARRADKSIRKQFKTHNLPCPLRSARF